ncbi:MAG: sigma-70 family RNA polymerase sigma factor [Saprospiraceae bacterium]|nr:sigma-70 family RNA polymerase sigma factor [Saprospiraceae bacterium]MCF8251528.1 sigma-70 family RNA polymerase sigma factor [Saprospiraceae bacterium]MCF8280858.1 sigma-70 family RNA polymerase sigma factor [Bacteroidales bacterium]MCF8310962.1 sigma-70 family RNA polymerase sigma factor [Saprospiraceae bacterium]MCF8439702.1 sigma-70 family RNA polymerase sigma factor [Saprospiraceae bacterium]
MNSTDEDIIHGCRKGERKAQQALYEKYKPMLFSICLRYASGWHEAEDWLQDGLVRIFANLYQYQPTGAFGAWLRRVMVNSSLEQLRKRKRAFSTVEIGEVAVTFEADDNLFAKYREEALVRMLQQLPEGYRAVFNLYVMEEYSHHEIGEMLGIAESASRSQLSRAKAMLRKMLEKSMRAEI